ncbi:MAG: hypothetical protein OXF02_01350 [Simkaniaceae bacterium]|nr:hypothetical protein [Simkaniaceae bacterium]
MATTVLNYGYKPTRTTSGTEEKAGTGSPSPVEGNAHKTNGLRSRIAAWRAVHPKAARIVLHPLFLVGSGALTGAVIGGAVGGVVGFFVGAVPGAILGTFVGIVVGILCGGIVAIVFSECCVQPTTNPEPTGPKPDNQVADVSEVGAGPEDVGEAECVTAT